MGRNRQKRHCVTRQVRHWSYGLRTRRLRSGGQYRYVTGSGVRYYLLERLLGSPFGVRYATGFLWCPYRV